MSKGLYPQMWLKLQGAVSTEKGWKHPNRNEILKCLKGADLKFPDLADSNNEIPPVTDFLYNFAPANSNEENLIHSNTDNVDVSFASLYSLDDNFDYYFTNNIHRIDYKFNMADGVKQVPLGFKVDNNFIDYFNSANNDTNIMSIQYDYYDKATNVMIESTPFGGVSGTVNNLAKSLINLSSDDNTHLLSTNMYAMPVDENNSIYTKTTIRLYDVNGDIVGEYEIVIFCIEMIM